MKKYIIIILLFITILNGYSDSYESNFNMTGYDWVKLSNDEKTYYALGFVMALESYRTLLYSNLDLLNKTINDNSGINDDGIRELNNLKKLLIYYYQWGYFKGQPVKDFVNILNNVYMNEEFLSMNIPDVLFSVYKKDWQ